LRTSARGRLDRHDGKVSAEFDGGVPATTVSAMANRWLEVSATDNRLATYILTASKVNEFRWLQAGGEKADGRIGIEDAVAGTAISWKRAMLCNSEGDGWCQHTEGTIMYEVFFGLAKDVETDTGWHWSKGNLSTPCGLLHESRRGVVKRHDAVMTNAYIFTGKESLEPGQIYVINVMARSLETGHSVAYNVFRGAIFGTVAAAPRPPSSFGSAPWLVMLAISVVLLCYLRPGCSLFSVAARKARDFRPDFMEMTQRGGSYSGMGSSSVGSYTPPPLSGYGRF
jgi:hypothetical protein